MCSYVEFHYSYVLLRYLCAYRIKVVDGSGVGSTSAVWECSELCTRLCFLLSTQEPGNEATYLHANSIYQPRDDIHHNAPAHKN